MCSTQNVGSTFACHDVGITHGRRDAFCVVEGARFDATTSRFDLDCTPDALSRLPTYMYDTGVPNVLRETFRIGTPEQKEQQISSQRGGTVVLVKRELPGNLWHSLLEIWSFWLTMDTLGFEAFAQSNDVQVVFVDSHIKMEPYADLWTVFSGGKKPLRMEEYANMNVEKRGYFKQVVIPLSGGSNPIWQGDWEKLNCWQSELVKTFSDRVLKTFEVVDKAITDHNVRITFLDRKGNRRFVHQDQLLAGIAQKYPDATIDTVDFTEMSFGEQLEVISNTTVLIGVHGAGMTHSIFMPEGSTIIDIMPPGLQCKGFENIAGLKHIGYFKIQGGGEEKSGASFKSPSWQSDDVEVHESDFVSTFQHVMKTYGKT
ncbi:hypothetical protein EJ05DRAFT_501191 [Pseudovirgaria hyperparasitica]|uniref:EGF domain-specific O-linked N-acetylglucosamine transferase n=1 Tax=Pseudovirgaria hyperparasitica TaxID=470096 RepID=A0A6A6W6K4_9PEZI|nr:uncharacterized protein EJ05DRAFT_501191 [Pseudovirgaria hyperparasitica]KAF2757664.1 hypothetical protein EJ05DRAFT_501191 [Pseudovirgaria hyperparasitica]